MYIIPTRKTPASLINVFCTFCGHSFFLLRSRMNPALQIFPVTLCSLFILVCGLLLPARGWAWEVNTHEELTEQAIRIMEGDLNTYLINNLGLEGGLGASVKGGTPRELMIQGSNTEDDGIRFLNHFHEPIENKGSGIFPGISAIKWSLAPLGAQFPGGKFSWNDAREYYFKALTSPTKTERDENWGKTFRALGQVMHLLQDSANPSHVRDDLHAFDDGLHDYMARHSVTALMGSNTFSPDPSMLEQPGPAGPNGEPFANLFDRDMYQGSAPEATLGTDIGVTEYTNANFFSDDTIPGQGSIFSTEISNPTVAELVPAPIPSPYLTLPRLGSAAFPGARAAKLTGNQAVAKFLLTNTNLDLLGQLQLDDGVYDAQAQNLIPRAVGYSAAVLDYFFRGQLQVALHEFEVLGTTLGAGLCDPTPDPVVDDGLLDVEFIIPSDLNFDGTAFLYYEQDEIRVLVDERTNPPSGQNFSLRGNILYASLDDPVQWYVVLDGDAGPGVQEQPRAIVATSDKAAWEFVCLE